MDLSPYLDDLRSQLLAAAAAGGDEAVALAERLVAPLESAVRLTLLDALSDAADELTRELAPGTVELRLRRGEPDFVVSLPEAAGPMSAPPPAPPEGDEGGTARINLRLPDHLKVLAEHAAEAAALSVNAWLVRVVANAVEPVAPRPDHWGRGRHTGWVR